MKTLFLLGLLLSRARRWRIARAHVYLLRARQLLACPALLSGLFLAVLTVPIGWTQGYSSIWGWAAIMATQLRWRGNRRVLAKVFNASDEVQHR